MRGTVFLPAFIARAASWRTGLASGAVSHEAWGFARALRRARPRCVHAPLAFRTHDETSFEALPAHARRVDRKSASPPDRLKRLPIRRRRLRSTCGR